MSALPEPNPQSDADQLETAVDQAIVACGGDARATTRALILANELLEASALRGFRRGLDHGRLKTYTA